MSSFCHRFGTFVFFLSKTQKRNESPAAKNYVQIHFYYKYAPNGAVESLFPRVLLDVHDVPSTNFVPCLAVTSSKVD